MLPPLELLSTRLRHISSSDGRLHTSPAWLGYGTLILSERARNFLHTFLDIEKDPNSVAMADNYYSILSNTQPELWFGQESDLGLGQPFSVGSAGDERNWHYMVSFDHAFLFLNHPNILCSKIKELAKSLLEKTLPRVPEKPNFIDRSIDFLPRPIWKAPCRHQLCIIETDAELLPEFPPAPPNRSLREIDTFRRKLLDKEVEELFLQFPLSFAVDGDEQSRFCAVQSKWDPSMCSLHLNNFDI